MDTGFTVVNTRAADAVVLAETLTLITPAADQLMAAFYHHLFTCHPDLESLFAHTPMGVQHSRVAAALTSLARFYDQPDYLTPLLEQMGVRHTRYGATLTGYTAVGDALHAALAEVLADAWPPQYAAVWDRAYMFAAGTMLAAGAVAPGLVGPRR